MPINGVEFVGTKDGRFRWVSTSKVPITDKNGKVIGTVGITHDIDKMMRVEQRLKSERDMLQLLIDHIPSPFISKTPNRNFTRVNLAQAKLLGANSPEDVIGKSDFDYYTPENADEFYNDEKNIMISINP
jgi:PAS domain-containing protein